jgi:hypothetical protein
MYIASLICFSHDRSFVGILNDRAIRGVILCDGRATGDE